MSTKIRENVLHLKPNIFEVVFYNKPMDIFDEWNVATAPCGRSE